MAVQIDANICTACGDCESVCPTNAIVPHKGLFTVTTETCNECEGEADLPQCMDACMEEDCITFVD